MRVTIIDRAPATVAFLRHTGPYDEGIPRFWEDTYVPWAIANRVGPDHARYGICQDDPATTPPEQCRYDACAEVPPDFVANGGARKATIPGGKHAVFEFNDRAERLAAAWAQLQAWLPSSGWQQDDRPPFEYYPKGASCDPATGRMECQICIPVRAGVGAR